MLHKYIYFLTIFSVVGLMIFSCNKEDIYPYDIKVIKKGSNHVSETPHILKAKDEYHWAYYVTQDIYKVDTHNGWAKLCGICFNQPHHNSYRFVFKVVRNTIQLGYYSYVDNVSPQENTTYKGMFDIDVGINDIVYMTIEFDDSARYVVEVCGQMDMVSAPLPIGFNFVRIECNPNINIVASEDLKFWFVY